MSSEAKQKRVFLIDFGPYSYGNDETKHNPTEKHQILCIRVQISFGTTFQTFQ